VPRSTRLSTLKVNPEYPPRVRVEWLIASSRVVLAGGALLAVAISPFDPGDDWRLAVEQEMVDHLSRLGRWHWSNAARHMLGLWHGRPGARRWRQVWCDHRLKALAVAEVQQLATRARLKGAESRHDAQLVHDQ